MFLPSPNTLKRRCFTRVNQDNGQEGNTRLPGIIRKKLIECRFLAPASQERNKFLMLCKAWPLLTGWY
ncbi:hypothetical protein DL564_25555 [Klebsiella quasipneumoniae]|nr:hypothetical protein BU230_08100 [Klebsiella pneumoniae]TQD19357.1 hypothetical protein DL564_25555 [Klebsiella quasipneumoniae]HBW8876324.1 hypothetical protein [Klebsiella quasipneumoniae subsp. similipneumoniae]